MAAILLQKQNELFGLISRLVTNLKKLGSANITKGVMQTRVVQLDRYWERFEVNHAEQQQYLSDRSVKDYMYFLTDVYSACEEKYLDSKSYLLDSLDDLGASSSASTEANYASSIGHSKSLPKITLPRFSGNYQDWIPFRDLFDSIVGSNPSLSSVEKLHYLKVNVTGDAAKLIIVGIPVTGENYERAWNKLKARFDNKQPLINSQLDIFFGVKPVQRKCARELETLRTTVSEVLEALDALGGPVEHWDYIVVYFICRRLYPETHEAWEIHLGGQTAPPSYKQLDTFLEGRIRALETVDSRRDSRMPSGKPRGSSVGQPMVQKPYPAARAHVSAPSSTSCSLCGAAHYIALCPSYKEKTPEQRREVVAEKRLCFNCLGHHLRRDCRTTKRCTVCSQQHHTTLHIRPNAPGSSAARASNQASSHRQTTTPSSPAEVQPSSNARPAAANHAVSSRVELERPPVLLATALVTVITPQGLEVKARALLDQGSELSFVRESLAQCLHIPRRHASVPLIGVGACKQTTTRGAVSLCFRSCVGASHNYQIDAYVLPKLTGKIPSAAIRTQDWDHLANLDYADPQFNIPGAIDLLLGADVYGHLLLGEIRRGQLNAPIAQLTTLGWIVSGPAADTNSSTARVSSQGFLCSPQTDLHELVHRFWEQETVPSPAGGRLSPADEYCDDHFQRTHSRDQTGRYTVRLPFKSKPNSYGDSRSGRSNA